MKICSIIINDVKNISTIFDLIETTKEINFLKIEFIFLDCEKNDRKLLQKRLVDSSIENYQFIESYATQAQRGLNEAVARSNGEIVIFAENTKMLASLDTINALEEFSQQSNKKESLLLTQSFLKSPNERLAESLFPYNFLDSIVFTQRKSVLNKPFDEAIHSVSLQIVDFIYQELLTSQLAIKLGDTPDEITENKYQFFFSNNQWATDFHYLLKKSLYNDLSFNQLKISDFATADSQASKLEAANHRTFELMTDLQVTQSQLRKTEKENLDKAKEIIKLNSDISRILSQKDEMLLEKDQKIIEQDDRYLELINSTTWKAGKAISYPLRKAKDLLKPNRSEKLKTVEPPILVTDLESNSTEVEEEREPLVTPDGYQLWVSNQEDMQNRLEYERQYPLETKPLISVLIPVYNVEKIWLEKCITSIKNQWYQNWQICIADDASTDPDLKAYLEELSNGDSRIKIVFRRENGHISQATNSALASADGEFIALVDNDDELAANAFYEVVKVINLNSDVNMIYSDEDKINEFGERFQPNFKPDWSPDFILNQNYISHLGIYRTSVAREIGGFRKGYEGSQDHDFLLRFTEVINEKTIFHIPKVLYHWRALVGSTAKGLGEKNYANEAGIRAVQNALDRRGIKGKITAGITPGIYNVNYEIIEEKLVSIIIPTKNGYEYLKACLDSIVEKTSYPNYEIVIVDNGSDDYKVKELLDGYQLSLGERFKQVYLDIPFNYSRLNNLAVRQATGEFLLFLNNDTKVITPTWIENMLGFAQFERIGCVGAKLLYPDKTIQHAGVILGSYSSAAHAFGGYPYEDYGYMGSLWSDYNFTVVTAACLMVSRKDFDAVSGFDESLAVAFNDVDFCIKVYQLGRNNVVSHQAELYHYESKSRGYEDTPEKIARFKKEVYKMQGRYGEFLLKDPAFNPNFALDASPYTKIGR